MKIKALLIMPEKEAQLIKIPSNLKFIRAFIGKDLYQIKLSENIMIIGNSNANHDDFNRIFKGNILLGTFLIVSIKNNHRTSMKKKDIRKYINIFKLRKHQKKVNFYKNEYLEEYYLKQKEIKKRNAEKNTFNIAA